VKALLLSHGNGGGGASRAAARLFEALGDASVDVSMHVDFKHGDDPRVWRSGGPLADARRRARITLEEVPAVVAGHPTPRLFSPGLMSAISARRINALEVDVVNPHWTNFGYLSIGDLGRIRKPLAWTLHDMWAFTGGLNYADDGPQARWRHGYRRDNGPDGLRWDAERWVADRKRRAWTVPRHVITPSAWLAEQVRASALLTEWPTHVIPNALDTMVFSPGPSAPARRHFGIDADARMVLVALTTDLDDPRKGFDLLRSALGRLSAAGPAVELAVMGHGAPPTDWPAGLPRTHWLGRLADHDVVTAYRAADAVVVPSRQDNLPQTGTEAQACGIPVVAFATGGLPDIVVPGETGYLAEPFDDADLAHGITWVLEDEQRRVILGGSARRRAVSLWSPDVVARAHIALFEEIIDEARRGVRPTSGP
jgi:glycosyltransferase involved in cell wall biosynthesis